MRKIILLAFVFLTSITAFAQDFSNKGKDFWTGYGYHTSMLGANGGSQDMVLYFATDQVTNITINIPATGYTQNITSAAGNNVYTSIVIPKTGVQDARLLNGGLSNNGIHITSNKPMVAYAHVYNGNCSGATILYPTNTLGREYYSVNYKNWSNNNNANCWFYVVAVDTGTTTIQITPQADQLGVVTTPASGSWAVGTTYTVNLTQGQIYNVMGILTTANNPFKGVDLTGSRIKSVNNGTGCKKIGVFSGSGRISITCTATSSSSDNYMVQALPKNAWGKKYLTVQANGNQSNNIYRVCVSDPAAKVKINGVLTLLPIQNNFYYEIPATAQPQLIEGDSSIMVAQYFTSQGACGNGAMPGDPEVIYLSPVEQNINKVIWYATPNFAITSHSLSVVIPNTGTALSSFTLNGAAVGGWVTHPQDPGYSYLRRNVGVGFNVIQSDSGFNATAYGFGGAESYGYNAGTNIKDLYQQIGVQTTYGIETTPSVCTNSPFKFKVSLPYIPDSMHWDFNGAVGMSPNNNTVYVDNTGNIAEDSFTVVNGRTIHWYSIPTTYTFSIVGSYPVTITTFVPNGECGSQQDIDFDLGVSDPPIAGFTWTGGGCAADSFHFVETTPQFPKSTYKFWWNFGDPGSGVNNDTSNLRNPVHLFSSPGLHRVRYSSITTPGCLSDTLGIDIIVPDFPNATIAGNTTVCINSVPFVPVTFTGTGGTAEYIFSYNINGGGTLTTPPSTGGVYILNAPTNVAGPFTYNLIGVRNATPVGTPCTRVITGQSTLVTINPLPTANISGTINVCQNAPSPLITFTGAAGTAPYTFTYNINGGGNVTVTTIAGNSVTVAAPTNVPGTFTYNLVSVVDASSTLCSQAQSGSAVVTVNPLPTAGIAGTTSVCKNAASPLVTFTGAAGTAPYTFTYNINGGANQTITTIAGNSVTIAAPTNVVGTFTYNLVSVLDASTTLCTQAQTGSAVITVNDLPTASIAGAITVCLNAASPNITFTGANTTAPYTFSYTINSGPVQTVTTIAGNSVTVPVPTGVAGTFTYDLVSVQDGSSTLCSQAQTGSAVVTVNSLPTAAIAGNTTVCRNAASPLVTFTGAVGTAPYTFTYNINGGANQTVTTVAGNSVTVPAPTNVVGVFNYNLVSVQEGSANTCSQAQSGTTVITVNDLPTASISGTTQVCRNAPSPNITFTGASTTAPYTFTYKINGGANQTVTTVAGNSVTVAVPTSVAGLFTYTLVSVQDGSSTTCSQAQAGSAVITVNALPVASFNTVGLRCANRNVSFNNTSTPNAAGVTTWSWDFGDPGSGPSNTSGALNPSHNYLNPNTAPGYTVTLTVTNSNGCISNPIASIFVAVNDTPRAGFIVPDVCINDVATIFTDTSTINPGNSINAWYWDFGDPPSGGLNTSTTQNGTHLYPMPASYTVLHKAISSFGCRDSVTHVIVINSADPVAAFTPANSCSSDSASITNQSTVGFGNVTRIDIYWDVVGAPAVFQTIFNPIPNGIYRHKYPTLQITKNYSVRIVAYSGVICFNNSVPKNLTTYATPKVQFNNIPNSCLLVPPYLITQGSEIGGVPGTGTYSGGPYITPGGLFNPQVAGIGTHSIKYTWTANNPGACIDTLTKTITVLDTAHATFSVVLPSCEQLPTMFTNLSTAPASVTLANTVWNFGDATPPQIFPIGSPIGHLYPGPGPYTVTMHNVSAAGCLSTDTSALINIDANHGITFDATGGSQNQTRCVNVAIQDIRYQLSGGATNIVMPAAGLPPGVTASVSGTGVVTITGAPTTAVGSPFTYSITTLGNTCRDTTVSGVITVKPDHAISWDASSGNQSQTRCVNVAIQDIKFQLSGGATNIVLPAAGLPPGVTASVSGTGVVTITGAPTTAVGSPFTYSITTLGNNCRDTTVTGVITVKPDHTISWDASSGNQSQTRCVNVAIQDIKFTLGGGANNIVMPPAGLPPGVTASVTGNVVTITGTPTTAVGSPFTYSITTLGNTCRDTTVGGVITVKPDDIIVHNLTSGDTAQSVCVNTAINPIVYNLGGGATGATASGLPPGVSGNPTAGNTFTISGTPTSYTGSPFNFTIQTNGNCLQANTIGQIAVHAYPVPVSAPDKLSYCIPNAIVKFSNNSYTPGGSGMTYAWDFGEPLSGSANTSTAIIPPAHWYSSAGPFNVTLSVTSIAVPILNGGVQGCIHDTVIVINTIHPQPKAAFVPSKPSVCIGDNVIFTDDTRGGGLIQQSFWNMGDGTGIQNGNPKSYTYSDTLPSPFKIIYYAQDNFGCNSDTITKPFYVYPYPHPNAGPDKNVLEGGSVQLDASIYGIEPQFAWTPVQFLTDSKILRPRVVNPKSDMTYRLTVIGKGGCERSDDVFVKLLKFPAIPNTFTPNNDGINDTWRIDYLNSYPDNRVQIFTRAGKLIFESRGYNTPWDGTFKGKPMPFDTYYYIIEPGNGRDPITGYVTIIK